MPRRPRLPSGDSAISRTSRRGQDGGTRDGGGVDLYVWWRRGERADRDRAAVLWSVRGREGAGTKETAVGLPEVSTVVDRNAVG
jgi:hypothetical protein